MIQKTLRGASSACEFGRRPYQQIFTPEVERVWKEQTQSREHELLVRGIRIKDSANELEAIALEALFDGEEFLVAGTRTTITRFHPSLL